MSLDDYLKEFLKLFNDCFDYQRRKWDVFDNFAEVAALYLHNVPYARGQLPPDAACDRIEQALREIEARTDRQVWKNYTHMVNLAMLATHKYQVDFMALVFHGLGMDDQGQSFTPWDVARAMVRLQFNDLDLPALIAERGVITVADHACGAGGLLLSFAQFAREKGIDPRTKIIFDAIDVDRRCFNMTYFQLSAANLMGNIHHGNTLTWEFQEHRKTYFHKEFDLINRDYAFKQACEQSMALLTGERPKPDILLRLTQMSLPI